MTTDQILIFSIIGCTMVLFIWDRWRYDLVALLSLFAAVIAGVVPAKDAFSGMADPVVVTVACVLVMSAAISRSGFIDACMRLLGGILDKPYLQVFALVTLVTALSAFMNNVGALAVFLPIAMAIARKANRSPSELLMPLAFGSLLGGMVTLIGTPPNILVSRIRENLTGEPFQMFDFTPVGLTVCAVGIVYLGFAWLLIPADRRGKALPEDQFRIEDYISEVRLPDKSPLIGQTIGDVEAMGEDELSIIGLLRGDVRRLAPSSRIKLRAGDVLVVESDPTVLKALVDSGKLQLEGSKEIGEDIPLTSDEITVAEVVVTAHSPLIGRTPRGLKLRSRFGVNLLAISRNGGKTGTSLRDVRLAEGNVLVLQGNEEAMPETLRDLGCLPLAERNLLLGRGKRAYLPVLIMAAAVGLSAFETLPISIAFLGAVLAIAVTRILRLNEMYEAIDAPVLILLAAMIPVSEALQTTGGSELVSGWLADFTQGMSAPFVLTSVLIASMLVTPFLNNGATVLLMAPIAGMLAQKLGLNVDAFLMAVAIGTSCDFLTPIGHQSNTLVMGPGGYRFNDYWKMGLPLSILVVLVSVPMLLWVWPVK